MTEHRASSWWVGLDRAAFQARAGVEQDRMRHEYSPKWVDWIGWSMSLRSCDPDSSRHSTINELSLDDAA